MQTWTLKVVSQKKKEEEKKKWKKNNKKEKNKKNEKTFSFNDCSHFINHWQV